MNAGATPPRLRVAVVGAGLMGRWHARYATRNGAHVVAIVDPNPAAARSLGARFGSAAIHADAETMLTASSPDVVHVCTPTATHMAIVAGALAAGAHVMVEKPVAGSREEISRLLAAADDAGVVLCPAYQFAFQNGFLRAREELRRHGQPIRADITICSMGAGRLGPDADEQLVREILPHPIAVLCMLMQAEAIDLSGWRIASRAAGERFACGRVGALDASVCISSHARPARCEMRVLCDHATLHVDFFHGFLATEQSRGGRIGKVMLPLASSIDRSLATAGNLVRRAWDREPAYPGLRALIAAFYAAVRGGAPPPYSRTMIETVSAWSDHVDRIGIGHGAAPACAPALASGSGAR